MGAGVPLILMLLFSCGARDGLGNQANLQTIPHFVMQGDRIQMSDSGSFNDKGENTSLIQQLISSPGVGFAWKTEITAAGSQRRDLHFQGIRIKDVQVVQRGDGQSPAWATGRIPEYLYASASPVPRREFLLTSSEAQEFAMPRMGNGKESWIPAGKAYLAGKDELIPAYDFRVSQGSLADPIQLFVAADTGSVVEANPMSFRMDGHAYLYTENVVAANNVLSLVTLGKLLPPGTHLASENFRVVNCLGEVPSQSGTCAAQATAVDGDFGMIPFEDERYDEIVAYYAVSLATAWNMKILLLPGNGSISAGSWQGPRASLGLSSVAPLTVFSRALSRTPEGEATYDNAQYLPGGLDGASPPAIVVGTGWEPSQDGPERALRFLGKDADVVLHEFHHHIIFRTMTTTTGETGAMHEGLADYFTYAITGNNKLGESIVPSTAPLGALRSGNMAGTIQQFEATASVHDLGMLWSSTLWQLRENLGPWNGIYRADKIIWDAVDLASSNETYYGFIAAIVHSAEQFAQVTNENSAELKQKIFRVFSERGYIQPSDGTNEIPPPRTMISEPAAPAVQTTAGPPTPIALASKATKKKSGWCSVTQANRGDHRSSIALLLLVAVVPLISRIMRLR